MPGTLIAAITAVIAVASAVATWISPRAILRRRIVYQFHHVTRIVSTKVPQAQSIQVYYQNRRQLSNPYILELGIRNAGAMDITAKQFDDQQPIIFDLAAEIIEVLAKSSTMSGERTLKHETTGSKLYLLPDLLSRRSEVRFTIITDGEPRENSPAHHLVHTSVINYAVKERRAINGMVASVIGMISGFAGLLLTGLAYRIIHKTPGVVWYRTETWPEHEHFPGAVSVVLATFLVIELVSMITMMTIGTIFFRKREKSEVEQ